MSMGDRQETGTSCCHLEGGSSTCSLMITAELSPADLSWVADCLAAGDRRNLLRVMDTFIGGRFGLVYQTGNEEPPVVLGNADMLMPQDAKPAALGGG